MQEVETKYREIVLKVVQKILIKTGHKAYPRLKFSSACSCEQNEAKVVCRRLKISNSFKTSVATPQAGVL